MAANFTANRIMSGTFGELIWDGSVIAECSAAQAKFAVQREDQQLPGRMAIDSKPTGTKGTGSITLKKVYSRFSEYVQELQKGLDLRATVIMKLNDPAALGAERAALYDVAFDDIPLMDWTVGKTQDMTYSFRFTDYELLEGVAPR